MQEVVKNHFVEALHFKKDPEFVGAIEFFTTLVLFEKEHAIEGLKEPLSQGSEAIVLDTGMLGLDFASVIKMSEIEFLTLKKKILVNQCIQKYCKEDCKVVEIFSDGYISELGLQQKQEVLNLVESIEDQQKLAARLMSFAKCDEEICSWARIPPTETMEKRDDVEKASPNTEGQAARVEDISVEEFLMIEESMS